MSSQANLRRLCLLLPCMGTDKASKPKAIMTQVSMASMMAE